MAKSSKKKKKDEKQRPWFDVHKEALKALWGIVLVIFFFLTILAFLGKAGVGGRIFYEVTGSILGLGRFIIPFIFLAASYVMFGSRKRNSYVPLFIGGLLFLSGFLGILNIFSLEGSMGGGYWGYVVSLPFVGFLGDIASFIIFLGFILASIIVSFNLRISDMLARRKEIIAERLALQDKEKGDTRPETSEETENLKVKTWQDGEEGEGQDASGSSKKEDNKQAARSKASSFTKVSQDKSEGKQAASDDFSVKDIPNVSGDFKLPPVELLEKETGRPSSGDIVANANIIKRTLQNFGIEVEMGEVNVGPTVTQFTLKPAEGVKLARILALHNDLSLALAAHPIRIEAPIPSRSLVGIEIPNKGIAIVRLKNLLESSEFGKRSGNLTLAIGRDVSGAAICADLSKMPHLLIAGSTGSGKTIALNIIILSLLYQNSPSLLKFILIDPKRVEFSIFADIPHLLAPIVVDAQKTVNALKWAVSEMERRFELLSGVHVRDISSFNSNKKILKEHGPLPYIVIVIDELADLMTSRGKEVEALIVRLAQMARAVGIHLILATQRPSVEVITGLIKANITSRIAFQVASQVDSRTVLDMAGAEKLLGNGDMLYLPGDASKPKRVQGAYITEKEVRRVADYLRESALSKEEAGEEDLAPAGSEGLLDFSTSLASSRDGAMGQIDFDGSDSATDDDLYEEARKLVIQSQKASSSLLQRRLRVGYARAARLIDMLEENGVIGPGEGAKPREVYMGGEDEA